MKKIIYLPFFLVLVLLFSCGDDTIDGCMDITACNYDSTATDDGPCDYFDQCGVCAGDDSSCVGCIDLLACNYNELATIDDGGCLYEDIEDPIKIAYVDSIISGNVGEELIAHIHVQNATCQDMSDLVVRKFNFTDAEVYFCFNGICFPTSTETAPNPLVLSSFETDDYFKGYLTASNPGSYEVNYRFYMQSNPQIFKSVLITYNVN